MKPRQVGRRVLDDHVELKKSLERIEALAGRVLAGGEAELAALRNEATGFLDALLTHIAWEDDNLAPALLAESEQGEKFAKSLAADHSEQRDLLEHILRGLADAARPGRIVARNLLDLCRLLRDDIVNEEEMLRDAGMLNDTAVVGADSG